MNIKSGVLHYRLFVEIDGDRKSLEKKVREQLYSWLRRKRLNADALVEGGEVQLGPHSRGSLAFLERQDSSRSMRAIVIDDNSAGQWKTTLTVDVPGNRRRNPWLWLDLHGPEGVKGQIPKLARSLLEVFDAKMDDVRQGEAQPIVDRGEVGELIEAACNPNRRGLIFVAGSDSRLPFERWLRLIRELLVDCVGLAGAYVLSPEATNIFNNAIGPAHRVEPWTLRSFFPGVEPDDANDGRRHKVLGHDRIAKDSTRRIAKMLGWRAREAVLDAPLPSIALRVDRTFEQTFDRTLLENLDRRDVALEERPKVERETSIEAASLEVVKPLLKVLEQLLGGGPITVDRVASLGELVELGKRSRESRAAISKRLEEYENALAAEREKRQLLSRKLEDTQLEYAIAEDERVSAEGEIRRLQKLLAVSNPPREIWNSSRVAPETEVRPKDCVELVSMMGAWRYVRFTGDEDRVRELDEHEKLGAWAGKIWDALAALDDYVRAVLKGEFDGNVHQYLGNAPLGYRTYSQKNHAHDESAQVKGNPRFKEARTFPVPKNVDPAGRVFMGAHFKIARYATITPRMHYYNDVRGSGFVYVGYIGKHLPNTQTN
jgi:hypothetical protein